MKTTGRVLHSAAAYDLSAWLMTFGRERVFRDKVLELAQITSGEHVLDIGCGTGTLAVLAKRINPSAALYGIDASPEMVARARAKARKARVEISFDQGLAEALPFPDATFDLVLSTVMLHHLPRKARLRCLSETRRVLKPNGRALLVDFEKSRGGKGFFAHFGARHGFVKSDDLTAAVQESGFAIARRGELGFRGMYFVTAVPA